MNSNIFTPEEIEKFALRTGDNNPIHKTNNGNFLGQIVMGTHLINRRMNEIRCGLEKFIEENLTLTNINAKFNYIVKANQEINWKTPLITQKKGMTLRTIGYVNEIPAIELNIGFSPEYRKPERLEDIFTRKCYHLSEQDLSEPEFAIFFIPPTLLEWKNNLIGSPEGINIEMINELHYRPTEDEITIEIGIPIKKPKKERKPSSRHPFPHIYRSFTQTRQGERIISSGMITVGLPEYLPPESFKSID